MKRGEGGFVFSAWKGKERSPARALQNATSPLRLWVLENSLPPPLKVLLVPAETTGTAPRGARRRWRPRGARCWDPSVFAGPFIRADSFPGLWAACGCMCISELFFPLPCCFSVLQPSEIPEKAQPCDRSHGTSGASGRLPRAAWGKAACARDCCLRPLAWCSPRAPPLCFSISTNPAARVYVAVCLSVLLLSRPLLAQLRAPRAPSLALIPNQRVQSPGSSTPGVALPSETDPSVTRAVSWHCAFLHKGSAPAPACERSSSASPWDCELVLLGAASSGPGDVCLQRWAQGPAFCQLLPLLVLWFKST